MSSWNICSLITRFGKNVKHCKLNDKYFVHELMGQDIFCLMETHIGEKEQNLLELKGYRNFPRS